MYHKVKENVQAIVEDGVCKLKEIKDKKEINKKAKAFVKQATKELAETLKSSLDKIELVNISDELGILARGTELLSECELTPKRQEQLLRYADKLTEYSKALKQIAKGPVAEEASVEEETK